MVLSLDEIEERHIKNLEELIARTVDDTEKHPASIEQIYQGLLTQLKAIDGKKVEINKGAVLYFIRGRCALVVRSFGGVEWRCLERLTFALTERFWRDFYDDVWTEKIEPSQVPTFLKSPASNET